MKSDITPKEADNRVSILINNAEVLRDAAQTIAIKDKDSEMTHLSGQFQNLLYDLRRMKRTTGPEDMDIVFDEGLKRFRFVREEKASDEALEKIDRQVGNNLESWD